MDKVLVNINVIEGIISAYRRAEKNQSRIYGIILGSKKNNIYYISEAIYGFIFESENPETQKKELVKMNVDSLKSLYNSLTQKFKLNNPSSNTTKNTKEKEIKFQSNDSLMILGGFVTDKELFSDLYRLHNTLEKEYHEIFSNVNKILLLVDPNHNDKNKINYGIKTYEWDTKTIKIKGLEKSNAFIVFRELKNEVVQQNNNLDAITSNKNLFEKIYQLKLEKNDKRNINELLLNTTEEKDKTFNSENNIEFIKMKIKEGISCLNLFQQFLENVDNKNNNLIINEDDFDKIGYILSELDPILNDKEIVDTINNDINKKYNVDELTKLIDVQLALSDKIRELIK